MRRSAVILLLALVVAACGEGKPATPTAVATGTFPATITADNGSVTVEAQPKRIVSLAPTATEILFAIGAGDQVVAVDDQSNYPPESTPKKTKLSGFEPNVEAIAGYQPDLIVFADDSKKLTDSFKALKIPALLQTPAKELEDSYRQIRALGVATGRTGAANALVERMRDDIADLVADAPKPSTPLTYYHELDGTYFSVTSSTFIGKVYAVFGLKNIADPADKSSSGYPQLSPEYIIQANPSLIFLADTKCCSVTAETVAKRPGWNQITAVKEGHVIALDDDIASRWGPRIVDFLRTISTALDDLQKAA